MLLLSCLISLYENECYPKSLALSIVQPIFKKKGSPNNPDNWRGVALIPTIAKIYTKILCSRLRSWSAEKNMICDNQAGFRAGYSTGDNVFVLKTLIDASLAKRKGRLYCCFVDFRKAFDSVCRSALWYKLGSLGVSGKFIKAVRQIYSLNKFAVKTSYDHMSEAIPSQSGVLQGCQLSPLLFILFINDLTEVLQISDQFVHALLFADDLVLISQTVNGLQSLLDRLRLYCEMWNLELNREKTKVMVFKKGSKLANAERWTYDQCALEVVKELRFLGILFSGKGQWKKHIKAAVGKARTRSLQVMKLSYRCPYLPQSLMLRVFAAACLCLECRHTLVFE